MKACLRLVQENIVSCPYWCCEINKCWVVRVRREAKSVCFCLCYILKLPVVQIIHTELLTIGIDRKMYITPQMDGRSCSSLCCGSSHYWCSIHDRYITQLRQTCPDGQPSLRRSHLRIWTSQNSIFKYPNKYMYGSMQSRLSVEQNHRKLRVHANIPQEFQRTCPRSHTSGRQVLESTPY